MLRRSATAWIPPTQRPTRQWLTEEYRLPAEGADLPGAYSAEVVPYLWGIFAALDDPNVRIVVMMKAAQLGWTFGLIGYLLGIIESRPTSMIMIFPKDGAAREFMDEKFVPAVKATPAMSGKIDVGTSRKNGNRALFKKFPGGFLKLSGSNSVSNVKSTPAELVVVEEPDDTNENIKEQGDSIRLAKERLKRYRRGKLILGGTPSVKGISRVEEYVKLSDQRVLPIACQECGDSHVLDWQHVSWLSRDAGLAHPVYGLAMPESAVYVCPHCGCQWDDWQRRQNILQTVLAAVEAGDPYCGWTPTVASDGGIAGFKELNELYACMPGTGLAAVVRDYLEAEHDAESGDTSGRIVFANAKLARPYELTSKAPDVVVLEERAEDYLEFTVPERALVLTAGVDVQHDRLAVTLWGWGPGEEMWLVYWGEIRAKGATVDRTDPCWSALDELLFTPRAHARGCQIQVAASSIDASDGQTSDTVYWYVRTRQRRGVMAVKGTSDQSLDREIFGKPRPIDMRTKTKADRAGVQVYIVGVHKAKDLLIGDRGRLTLTGQGPGRMHWYRDVRVDFYEQLTSEVKAPHRRYRGKLVWQLKAGVRNEALDCAIYALHAARSLRLHLWNDRKWQAYESRLLQSDLFQASAEVVAKPAPAAPQKQDWIGETGDWL